MIGGKVGIIGSSGGAIDPDAAAYIAAAGITDGTEIAAIEQLFSDLKGTGSTTNNSNIYSKFYALYPISPTGISAGAVNAVNPGTYDITWYNSPTYGTTGVTGNATNMYGDTNFNPNTVGVDIDDFGFTIDIATYTADANDIDAGYNDGTNFLQINLANSTYTYVVGSLTSNISGTIATTGIRTASRRGSSDLEGYLNGATDGTDTGLGGAVANLNISLMGRNNSGTTGNFSGRRYRFAAIHTGLTDNEAQDLYDAITTYNANVISGGR